MKEIPKTDMPTWQEFCAAVKRRSFLLTALEWIEDRENSIKVKMYDDFPVAFNKTSRRIFEREIDLWRWPAGGAGIILKLLKGNKQALLTLNRDKNAPTYAGHNTLGSGLGCSLEEMLNPRLLIREAIEETIINLPNGIVYPAFETNSFSEIDFKHIAKDGASLRIETEDLPLIKARASVLEGLHGEKEVIVEWKGKQYFSRGLILLDKGVNGIDVLNIIAMELEGIRDWDEIKIFDGETIGGGNLLNRPVHAYELNPDLRPTGKIIESWNMGIPNGPLENKFPKTPVLEFVYDILKKH